MSTSVIYVPVNDLQANATENDLKVKDDTMSCSTTPPCKNTDCDDSSSDAKVYEVADGFMVRGVERLNYDFKYVDHVFDPSRKDLAAFFDSWRRCLAICDKHVADNYGADIQKYFEAHEITLDLHIMHFGEQEKTMETMLKMEDKFASFGLIRKEPVLVIGGGLMTDVAGFACACYKRSSNFIRIPTTLIGLIDAAVAIKVAVNHGKLKNRLGAYHAPLMTFLDFTFLRTLPEAQIRNGTAELIKIAAVNERRVFDLIEKFGPELISTRYGQLPGSPDAVKEAAKEICHRGIKRMLELETPNLHELMLDRVIAFGHTWSPTLELTPEIPLRHGHAVNIDMAFSTTIAWKRGYIGEEDWERVLMMMSNIGLSLDHPLLTYELLLKANKAIVQTRDGLLRAAVPKPIGECHFINDLTDEELKEALMLHKSSMKKFPRNGAGVEPVVDPIDIYGVSALCGAEY